MAWNLKYYAEWYDDSRDGLASNSGKYHNRLEFYTENIVSAPGKLTIRSFKIKYPTKELFGDQALMGCGADIGLITEYPLQLSEFFYTENPLGIQVRHIIYDYTEENTDAVTHSEFLNFIGYIDTDQYSDPISEGINYEMNITANNGINTLEKMEIVHEDVLSYNRKLEGFYSIPSIIQFVFQKLNYDWNYLYIDTYLRAYHGEYIDSGNSSGQKFPTTEYKNAVTETYIHADNFYDETDEPKNCRQAVNDILLNFGIKLYIYNGSIFLMDFFSLKDIQLNALEYDFSTLTQTSNGSILMFTPHTIDQRIGDHEVSRIPSKKRVEIQFNKYVYSSPNSIDTESDDFSGLLRMDDFYQSDELAYRELVYNNCVGYEKLMPNVEFVKKVSKKGEGNEEYYVRTIGAVDAQGFGLRIDLGQLLISSRLFLGLTGQIMMEDPDNPGVESTIHGDETLMTIINFFVRLIIVDKNGTITDYYTNHGSWNYPYSRYNRWQKTYDKKIKCQIHPRIQGESIKYNRWYHINGEVLQPEDDPYDTIADNLNGIIIPLHNYEVNGGTPMEGGRLYVDFYIPYAGTSGFGEHDEYDMVYNFKNMLIKDFGVKLLTSENRYSEFSNLNQKDVIYRNVPDIWYANKFSLNLDQGVDMDGISRGMFFIYTNLAYHDSGFAWEPEGRYARASYYAHKDELYPTENLVLEEVLLNTYLQNLEKSRYQLNCTLKGYYRPFSLYRFELLKRNGVNVNLVANSIEVDYVTGQTALTLEEII